MDSTKRDIPSAWKGFRPGTWQDSIDVRDFIQRNYTPYEGDASFLSGPTARTWLLNVKFLKLLDEENAKGGVLGVDVAHVSSLCTYRSGYLDRENELIVGLQTESPLVRGVNPFGGMRMARQAANAYGYRLSAAIEKAFEYKTTHTDGVFPVYPPTIRTLRSNHVLTGLPDAYGRGRIVGDYRRVALYGVDRLIAQKESDKRVLDDDRCEMSSMDVIRGEELWKEIDFLGKLKEMARMYGYDISGPATTAREAIQWTYFAYLGAVKEQNGAAMSLGRTSTFFDIYIERDLAAGKLSEEGAQELFDDFALKLRMVRQLRTPEYNELFAGDPNWITESVGGMGVDGRTLVTKSSFRMLHTLENLGPAPEPNLTVLWSRSAPTGFKRYAARLSIETDSIQYENDDLMRPLKGDDYCIACCVSAMRIGREMQYFGARCNVPKVLLLAINGGRDEITGQAIGPAMSPLDGPLNFAEVRRRFLVYLDWVAGWYVKAMNIIHCMHDRYAYEKVQMALHDTDVKRLMAFGIAGLSVTVDSLSAIRYACVTPIRDARGLTVDFKIEGDFPKFGNDDPRADAFGEELVVEFLRLLKKHPAHRGARHTLSVLTITSNVVYGQHTGATPDGRKAGVPFAPGANPMNNRDSNGAGRYLQHLLGRACRPRRRQAGADQEPRAATRRLLRAQRPPHQRERARPRDAARRPGPPREVPAAHHPRLGLRRPLREAVEEASGRGDRPHFPQHAMTVPRCASTLSRRSVRSTAPVSAASSSCRDAICAAATATTPTPRTS